jgi:hypothetical protein
VSFAGVGRGLEAELLDPSFGVVALDEGGDRSPDLVEILDDASADDLLLEGAIEAFGDAVGLGLRAGVDAHAGLRFALQVGESSRSLVVPIDLGSLQFRPTVAWEPRLRPGAEVRLSIPDLKLEGASVSFVPEGGSLTNSRGLNHALNEGELRIFVPAAMGDGQGRLVLEAGYTTVPGGELVHIAFMQRLPLVVTRLRGLLQGTVEEPTKALSCSAALHRDLCCRARWPRDSRPRNGAGECP